MEDSALIHSVLTGHRHDFAVLVERYQQMLYAFIYRLLQDPAAADEVVQVTFVQAYTHLVQLREAANFKSWLHQIARNQCRQYLRKRRLQREVTLDEIPEATLAASPSLTEETNWHQELEVYVTRLPERQRAVLVLRVFSELSFQEIGVIEGISVNAAKVNYHHAVTRLKQWLSNVPS